VILSVDIIITLRLFGYACIAFAYITRLLANTVGLHKLHSYSIAYSSTYRA